MNLINMKTGARVCSSSSKHDALLSRYKDEDENYQEASQLEYELAGILFTYGFDIVQIVMNNLTIERRRLERQ